MREPFDDFTDWLVDIELIEPARVPWHVARSTDSTEGIFDPLWLRRHSVTNGCREAGAGRWCHQGPFRRRASW
jgi:hypothetical protein